MNSTICLNMIVKDESHIIKQTLENIIKYIKLDYWVICDTGSSDNTINIIETFFKERNIPGEIHIDVWKDFAHNRNKALERAYNKTDYIYIMDADDEIRGSFVIPETMTFDTYKLKFGNDIQYTRPQIVNNRKLWQYIGVLHETIHSADGASNTETTIDGDYYLISGRTGNRSKNPNKYRDDADILSAAYKIETIPWLKDRYAFYAAQSYKDAGDADNGIKWYKEVLTLNNWVQEKFYSALQIGIMYQFGLNDIPNAIYYYLKTLSYDNKRWEGLTKAVELLWNQGDKFLAWTLLSGVKVQMEIDINNNTKLFIDLLANTFSIFWQVSYYGGWSGDISTARQSFLYMINNPTHIPANYIGPYVTNCEFFNEDCREYYLSIYNFLQYCEKNHSSNINIIKNIYSKFNSMFVKYNLLVKQDVSFASLSENITLKIFDAIGNESVLPPKLWAPYLTEDGWNWGNENSNILLTITSCKRTNLLIKTLDSLYKCATDLSLLAEIICIDDQSSDQDILFLKNRYPWIKFVQKPLAVKGHKSSMKMIREILIRRNKISYWMHLEDDWDFIIVDNYISRAIGYLEKYKKDGVRQILFNKGYGEIECDGLCKCGMELEPGLLLHVYNEPNTSCGYWPHYSFRPSVVLKETMVELGDYNDDVDFFELEYAHRYINAGYKSAYFDQLSCIHIGKLAGARGDESEKNAYELNNISQGIGRPNIMNDVIKFAIFCINLERRPDRLTSFKQNCPFNFVRIDAVDGAIMNISNCEKNVLKLLNNKPHISGETGCKLSHYRCWKTCVDGCIIFEDDIEFSENIEEQFSKLLIPPDCDLVYIGGKWDKNFDKNTETSFQEQSITDANFDKYFENTQVDGLFKHKCNYIAQNIKDDILPHLFNTPVFRCAGGYILTKKGADKLISLALTEENESFVDYPLDIWLVKLTEQNLINTYDYLPHCTYHVWDPYTGNIRRGNTEIYTDSYYEQAQEQAREPASAHVEEHVSAHVSAHVEEQVSAHVEEHVVQNNYYALTENSSNIPVFMINLLHRTDRMDNFKEYHHIQRFDALYSKNINSFNDEDERILFERINDTHLCLGVLGCKISHRRLWKKMTTHSIILEDDVIFNDPLFSDICSSLNVPFDCDMIYIGGCYGDNYGVGSKNIRESWNLTHETLEECFIPTQTKHLYKRKPNILGENTNPCFFHGFRCTGAYVVTMNGRKKLLELSLDNSSNFMVEAIDNWFVKLSNQNKINIYEYFPHLVKQPWDNTSDIIQNELTLFNINLKIKTVKFLGPQHWFIDDNDIMQHYGVMCNDLKWGNLQLTTNKTADVYVIINKPQPDDYFDPAKTIILHMEPHIEQDRCVWGEWSNPDKKVFFHVHDNLFNLNVAQSQFRIPDVIDNTKKRDVVSSIQSHYLNRIGHKLRIDFLKYADKIAPELFNVFGRSNYHELNSYVSTIENKIDGFLNYKYYFMAEPESYDNFASEKIWEPILCECLCFYWGCPNLESYIDEKAFVRLDLHNPEESLNIIKTAISENWWEKRYQNILNAKEAILNKYGVMPTINRIANNMYHK